MVSKGGWGGGHNGHIRLFRHGRGWACWLACSDCGACVGGGVEIVYNLYTFFGVGGGVVVSLHQRFDEGAALPGKPAMMYIYKVYVRRACDDQIVLLTNQIEVIDHD